MKVLTPDFFDRNAESVAVQLIGCSLVKRSGRGLLSRTIIETEAYIGPHDLASHASRGRTKRTEVMFGPPGCFYVYLVYGLHWMLNVVTGPVDYPAAVLIRGVEGVVGPGLLAKAFGITAALNGQPAAKQTGLWFNEGVQRSGSKIIRSARIGVGYAGPVWSTKNYRFQLKD